MTTTEEVQQAAANAEALHDEMMHEAIDALGRLVQRRIEQNKRELEALPEFEPRAAKRRARNALIDTGTIANGR